MKRFGIAVAVAVACAAGRPSWGAEAFVAQVTVDGTINPAVADFIRP